jgi:hypothetical protein
VTHLRINAMFLYNLSWYSMHNLLHFILFLQKHLWNLARYIWKSVCWSFPVIISKHVKQLEYTSCNKQKDNNFLVLGFELSTLTILGIWPIHWAIQRENEEENITYEIWIDLLRILPIKVKKKRKRHVLSLNSLRS